MAKYEVRLEARPEGKSGGVVSHVSVEAESDYMAERLAKEQFLSRNASYRTYTMHVTQIKRK